MGYRPKGNLDWTRPPRGGSGVPSLGGSNWECAYCGSLHREKELSCCNCGAPRGLESVVEEQLQALPRPLPLQEFWM